MLDSICPLDPGVEPVTTAGTIHLLAAMVAFVSFQLAALILSWQFRTVAGFATLARPAGLLALVMLVLLVGDILAKPALQGLTQRLFVGACLARLPTQPQPPAVAAAPA